MIERTVADIRVYQILKLVVTLLLSAVLLLLILLRPPKTAVTTNTYIPVVTSGSLPTAEIMSPTLDLSPVVTVTVYVHTSGPDLPTFALPTRAFVGREVTLTGRAAPDSQLQILMTRDASVAPQVLSQIQVGADGQWLYSATFSESGAHQLSVQSLDQGVVVASSEPALLKVAVVPTVNLPAEASVTSDATFNGTGQVGSPLQLLIDGQVVSLNQVGEDGQWSASTALDEPREYQVSVQALDENGTVLIASETKTLLVAVATPTLSVPIGLLAGSDLTANGTGEPNSDLNIIINGQVVGSITVGGDGQWSYSTPLNQVGEFQVTVQTLNRHGTVVASSPIATLSVEQAPTDGLAEAPTDVPAEVPAEAPTNVPAEVPAEVPTNVPAEVPTEVPAEVPTEVPTDVPAEVPEVPTDVPAEAPTAVPAEVPTDVPAEVPTDVPAEAPTAAPAASPTAVPAASPTDVPAEAPTAAPAASPTDVPAEVPTAAPAEVPTDVPTAAPAEVPTAAPAEVPTDVPAETPTDVPTAVPAETPTEVPAESPTEVPTESPTEVPTDEPVLTLWHGLSDEPAALLQQIADEWAAQQGGVRVQLEAQEELSQTLRIKSAEAQALPALAFVRLSDTLKYVEADVLLPLDSKVKEEISGEAGDTSLATDLADYYPEFLQSVYDPKAPLDGQLMAWPVHRYQTVLFMNSTRALEVGGYVPPTSWEELKEACVAHLEQGGESCWAATPNATTALLFVASREGTILDETGEEVSFQAPLEEALGWIDELRALNAVYQAPYEEAIKAFVEGKTLFTFESTQAIPDYQAQINDAFEMIVLEAPSTGDTPVTVATGGNVAIFRSDETTEALAWEFLKYWTSTEVNARWANALGAYPVRASALETLIAEEEQPGAEEGLAWIAPAYIHAEPLIRPQIEDALTEAMINTISGLQTPSEAANEAASKAKEYLSNEN